MADEAECGTGFGLWSGLRADLVTRRAGLAIQLCVALLVYSAAALLFFGRSLFGGFSIRYLGREADPTVMMWLFEWWPYAIAHRINLFVTHLVWAPVGFNLASMTSIPLLALAAYPLTRTLGLVAAYNLMVLLGPITAALSAFALCRFLTRQFWPSLLGGYLFGFSAYMLGQMLGHLCLVMVFALPLMALVMAARLNRDLGRASFVLLLALALAAQFLIDLEVFATGLIFVALTFAALVYCTTPSHRDRYYREIPLILASLSVAALIVSPYLYYYFAFPQLKQPFWQAQSFSTDLLNFLIPTPTNLLGANHWITDISDHFPARLMERGGYIPLPVFAIVFSWARRHWKSRVCRALVGVLITAAVAALGPWLHAGGKAVGVMPWLAATRMPLLEHVLPARLVLIVSLLLAVIVALWMADPEISSGAKGVAAALALMMAIPNPSAEFWSSPVEIPEFFQGGSARRYLTPQDVVLTLPWGDRGASMLWQAECGMCFKNVGGWTGVHRFAIRRWPIVSSFLGARAVPDPELQFKAFLAETRVSAIVVDDTDSSATEGNSLAETLGVKRTQILGVSFYRIPPHLLDRYRSLTGSEMESRADRARFDIMVHAIGRYLDSGHDPRQLSVNKLAGLGLIPESWRTDGAGLIELWAMKTADDMFAVAEYGSYAGLRGTMEAYRPVASMIAYPLPAVMWEKKPPSRLRRIFRTALTPPASGPVDGASMHVMAIYFTRAQLAQAAALSPAPDHKVEAPPQRRSATASSSASFGHVAAHN